MRSGMSQTARLLPLLLAGAAALLPLMGVRAQAPPARARPFRVAGYLPTYRADRFDEAAARQLTDLILFSAAPSATGELDLARVKSLPWERLRAFKTREHVRLLLCVGGWGHSDGFAAVAASPEMRRSFAQSAVRACREQGLDGLDLDWEHPKDTAEQSGYGALLTELRKAFRPHGLQLSVTMAAWQKLPAAGFQAADWVQVMAYDHPGRHSTSEAAQADVTSLTARGVPAEKIILGLPFYGRHTDRRAETLTYREIVTRYQPRPEVDEVEGLYFNGPATIRAKTEYALRSRLGGVMVWELGQDAPGEQSLLRPIHESLDRRAE